MNIKFSLSGQQEIIQALSRIEGGLESALEEILHRAARPIELQAESNAPGSGHGVMKDTIEKNADRVVVGVGADKERFYLNILEVGRVSYVLTNVKAKALFINGRKFAARAKIPKLAANPWLRPAFNSNEKLAKDLMKDGYSDAIKGSL